jgi:phosphoribosylanthranilate isomerase
MTWIKFCGMTRRSDVEMAAALGVDAVGFVTYPGSPRAVKPEEAARLGEGIEPRRFLVTVDLGPEELLEAAALAGVDGVQPHGRRSVVAAAAAQRAGYEVLFPVPVARSVDLGDVPTGAMPLLDVADPGRHGGTGRTFDWRLAEGLDVDFVLAGGLKPGNVAAAVRITAPWGVDVSSGIEQAPRVKDQRRMREFVEALR